MPGTGRAERSDRRSARQVGAVLVALQRHTRLLARARESRRAGRVGGVAQVDVDLEHRSPADRDVVQRLVAVGVVGMRRVGHVAGGAHRCGDRAVVVVAGAARGRGRCARGPWRADRTARRARTCCRPPRGRTARARAARRRPARRPSSACSPAKQVTWLSSRGADTSSDRAPVSRLGAVSWVISSKPRMSSRGDAGSVRDPVQERARCRRPDGVDVALRVELDTLALGRQVDRQLRHPQDRLVDVHQVASCRRAAPGVPATPRSRSSHELSHAPPYGSSATTPRPSLRQVVVLLEPQVGAVGVPPDDAKAVCGLRARLASTRRPANRRGRRRTGPAPSATQSRSSSRT